MKDLYSTYADDELWSIKEVVFDRDLQNIRESQFALGNGYLGVRGVLEELPHGASPGTFLAGAYDRITSQVSELINFPNPFFFKFTVDGEKFGAGAMDVLEHRREINMRNGLLLRRTVYRDSKKRRYDYQSLRFVSMQDKQIGAMQIALTPLDDEAQIEVQTIVDIGVHNIGVVTEGQKRHFCVREVFQDKFIHCLVVETLEKHHQVVFHSGLYYRTGGKKVYASDNIIRIKLKKKQTIIFTKLFSIDLYSTNGNKFQEQKNLAKKKFSKAFKTDFEKLLKKHIEAWQRLWQIADLVIEGTSNIQKNLRFNIYHMLISAHVDNGFSSVGARTLSGEGYHGHIFWDAEIYLLPFYIYVLPETARNMLLYRYHRLKQARAIATSQRYRGVMFPWESAGTGEEETPTWAKNFDGSIIKIKTDKLEHHITADIAFACVQYAEISGDQKFMQDHGLEILFETARFWASRVEKNKKGKYEIKDVIGPDEFHEHVDNNAYTNVMAKWNLLTAYKYYQQTKKRERRTYRQLCTKLSLTDQEVVHWKYIAPRIVLNMRKDRVIEEFDGFFKKRFVELVNYDENNIPLLPEGVKIKDYNLTQLVKQADVLMFLYLLSDSFHHKTKESNFWFYVNRTLHKSSLSASMHALMALEIGAMSRAYQFFNVALRADISNIHGNTAEGIHAASLGGVWQSVVNGFAGLRPSKGILSIEPKLPRSWKKLKFNIFWKERFIKISIKANEVRMRIQSKQKEKLKVRIFGKNHIIGRHKEYIFKKLKTKMQEGYY